MAARSSDRQMAGPPHARFPLPLSFPLDFAPLNNVARARRAAPSATAREIERARATGPNFGGNRQRVRLSAASRASAPPALRLIAA